MTTWRRSTYSSTGNTCVELADLGEHVALRNSNQPDVGTLTIGADQMAAFIDDVKAGRLDAHA